MPKRSTLTLITLGLGAALAYRFRRRLIGWPLKLPPAQYDVGIQRDARIPTADGVALMADHYYPKARGSFPTILIRSPYGKGLEAGPVGFLYAFLLERFAERGYHVIAQGTRGRFNSGGEFNPLFDEAADGQATLEWIARQPWFDGSVGMWGPSYLGYAQWAIATNPRSRPYLKAIVPILTGSQFVTAMYPDGSFGLDLALHWIQLVRMIGQPGQPTHWMLPQEEDRRLAPFFNHLPLMDIDEQLFGKQVPFIREGLQHPRADDPHWQPIDHSREVGDVAAAAHFISGWYDWALRELLADYAALQAAGRAPHLTIGPWYHADIHWVPEALRLGLNWFDVQLKGRRELLREKPVRIYVMGADEWRDIDAWPPPAREVRYYLHHDRRLSIEAPEAQSTPDRYRYDPADPTPSVGGALINLPNGAALDNRALEARPDVLTYTTPPLENDVEVIGGARLELYARSGLEHTDFFGRVCDVQPDGRSINICDGLLRVEPANLAKDTEPSQGLGIVRLEIKLWPTAHRFLRGHCIRLQVSSGAHPRWARNLGTGEPIGTATRMLVADQTIYHDNEHPSALVLPVTTPLPSLA